MKIIAVDFDGTLCKDAYPAIGEASTDVIQRLKQEQANGAKTILWTCREGALLFEAVTWCTQHDLTFNAINDNIPEQIARYSNNCRKVYADEYWDDRGAGAHGKWSQQDIVSHKAGYGVCYYYHAECPVAPCRLFESADSYCPSCGAKMDLED